MTLDYILPVILGAVVSIAILMYTLLDGFDLGIGILFPFRKNEEDRSRMMNAIAPVWDGNETWLVLGGGGILACFPRGYAALFPAIYLPVIFMLIALIFRGIAFEFRLKSEDKAFWGKAFAFGSIFATFFQGMIFSTAISGLNVVQKGPYDFEFVGSAWGWFSFFNIFCGLGLICAYTLLGATWLIKKTENDLREWSCSMAKKSLIALFFFTLITDIWFLMGNTGYRERIFSESSVFIGCVFVLSILPFYFMYRTWKSLNGKCDHSPFFNTWAIFISVFLTLLQSCWPYIVPYKVTLWEGAAATDSMIALLVGVVVVLPLILYYTFYIYKVFKGKVSLDSGYGH